jgi:hypothetical protein
MDVRISVAGIIETRKDLVDCGSNQAPFAIAKALTLTAKSRQAKVQQGLGSRFILRRASFIKSGVRIEPATKTKLQAVVKDINPFMERQETGGTKLPTHGSMVAVPLSGARPSPRSLISPENMPAAVMQRGGFIRTVGGRSIMYAVAFKAGRRKRDKFTKQLGAANWSRKIVPMYVLVHSATVRPRYEFEKTVTTGIEDEFAQNLEQTFAEARRTAK